MVTWFGAVYSAVLVQRLGELVLARRNRRWIVAQGGYEVGADHYPWIVTMHSAFLVCLGLEVLAGEGLTVEPRWGFLAGFLLAQGLRFWVLVTLGPYWNTRIFVLPGAEPVTRGPYRWLKHPNYLVVAVEILCLPMAFGAVGTALVFSLLNLAVLRRRIQAEEAALEREMDYGKKLAGRW